MEANLGFRCCAMPIIMTLMPKFAMNYFIPENCKSVF